MRHEPRREQAWISAQLVRRAQAGEEEARERLLALSTDTVRTAIFNAFSGRPPRHDLADITHDVYAKVLENLGSLKSPDAYPHWLYQLATNRCRDSQRRRREVLESGQPGGDEEAADCDQGESWVAVSREVFEDEEEALGARMETKRIARRLSPENYELLWLHHGLELDRSEILSRLSVKKSEYYDRLKVAELHLLLVRATEEQRLSNYAEARKLHGRVLTSLRRPEESKDKRFLYASALTRLADILQVQGSVLGPDQALALYTRAVDAWRGLRDRGNALYAWHMVGLCYNITERFDEALGILREVEEELRSGSGRLGRPTGNVRRDIGSVYLTLGETALARKYIERSIALLEDGESAAYRAALRKLGEVRRQEGKADQAVSLIERSVARVPSDQALLYTQGYIALCDVWLSLNERSEALRWAQKARSIALAHGFLHQVMVLDRLCASYGLIAS